MKKITEKIIDEHFKYVWLETLGILTFWVFVFKLIKWLWE